MAELRDLPKVDDLARSPELAEYPEQLRVTACREAISQLRAQILAGGSPSPSDAITIASRFAANLKTPNLPDAINMSGVILHTGLGRARLAPTVVEELTNSLNCHTALEFDLEDGSRGDRQSHIRDILCYLTGAEDAMVVNNAAAALVLSLRAIVGQKDVLLSRGQMVEIGGSFRVPDIVKESGCRLVEVGATNKTHLSDYKVTDSTGAILVCHRSNFEIVGFTSEPSISDLAKLGVPVVDDMGTGCMVDLSRFGLRKTKTMADSIREGASIAIGSGDKLLGGPQAGLIVGRKELISQIRKSPLARAMRVDKMTILALKATLALYASGRELEIPTLRYLAQDANEVKEMADRLAELIGDKATVEPSVCEIGGGSGPGTEVPSYRVGISHPNPTELARTFRLSTPAIIGRIENGVFWLDPRTAEPSEVDRIGHFARQCLA